MTQPTGVHHIAIMASDIKKHIEFYSEVMGCPLVALFDMHGVPGAIHAFLQLNEKSYFSIVQLPGVAEAEIEIGRTHAGSGAGACAAGTLQHLAFRVEGLPELIAMRDRIRSRGVNVIGPVDHGFCQSIYFAEPDQATLEVAVGTAKIEPDLWLDPAAAERVGIDADDIARYRNPEAYAGPSPVPQPPYDPTKPHQTYPEAAYQKMLSLPDEVLSARSSFTQPPVAPRPAASYA